MCVSALDSCLNTFGSQAATQALSLPQMLNLCPASRIRESVLSADLSAAWRLSVVPRSHRPWPPWLPMDPALLAHALAAPGAARGRPGATGAVLTTKLLLQPYYGANASGVFASLLTLLTASNT